MLCGVRPGSTSARGLVFERMNLGLRGERGDLGVDRDRGRWEDRSGGRGDALGDGEAPGLGDGEEALSETPSG